MCVYIGYWPIIWYLICKYILFCSCLYILLIVSFAVPKFSRLIWSYLAIYAFLVCVLGVMTMKSLPRTFSWCFSPRFTFKNFPKGTLLHCWWECKLVQPLWRTVWRFLKKLEIELQYDPAIPLLGIHMKETRSERDTCTPMFITALFIIARTWKQPRCPSADEWIRKLWYIYTLWNITQPSKRIHLNQF